MMTRQSTVNVRHEGTFVMKGKFVMNSAYVEGPRLSQRLARRDATARETFGKVNVW